MARYGTEHKEATRRRIVETADGDELKRDGIAGSGIATLMADAGLTNGAFYAHFDSKDDLVATVVGDQPGRAGVGGSAELPGGRAGLERSSCTSTCGLRTEITPTSAARRRPFSTRSAGAPKRPRRRTPPAPGRSWMRSCTRLAPEAPESATGTAIALFTMLVESIRSGRAVSDGKLSDAVLEEGIRSAEALIRGPGEAQVGQAASLRYDPAARPGVAMSVLLDYRTIILL